jgi:hypothetical protein
MTLRHFGRSRTIERMVGAPAEIAGKTLTIKPVLSFKSSLHLAAPLAADVRQ